MNKSDYPTCRTCQWLRGDDPWHREDRECDNDKSIACYAGRLRWQRWYSFGCIHHKTIAKVERKAAPEG